MKVLSDPHPIFVSMVGHGANQTPFKAVKVADLSEVAKKEVMKDKQPETVTKGAETPATEIHKIMFKGDKWKTTDAVEKYLTSKGYSNFKIEEDGDTFIVPAIAESEFDAVSAIKGSDEGVTMFVGTLKESAAKGDITVTIRNVENPGEKRQTGDIIASARAIEGDNPPELAAGSPLGGSTGPTGGIEQMIKEEVPVTARARTKSNKMTMAECMNEYNNGLPVGFYDASMAFASALRDLVSKGELKKISALAAEYGTLLQKLAAALPLQKAEERDAALKKFFAVSKEEVPSSDATEEQSDITDEEEKEETPKPPVVAAESAIAEPSVVPTGLEVCSQIVECHPERDVRISNESC